MKKKRQALPDASHFPSLTLGSEAKVELCIVIKIRISKVFWHNGRDITFGVGFS